MLMQRHGLKRCVAHVRNSKGVARQEDYGHGASRNRSSLGAGRIRIACPVRHGGVRHYASQQDGKAREIAVVGGGITGMATAWLLARAMPQVNVTLFENQDRLGGWMQSTPVDVGNGEIIFDSGPRSLRAKGPNGAIALRLIEELGLVDELLITPTSSPAAHNRYIYFPDRLVRMPGPGASIFENVRTLFFEPIFRNLFSAIAKDTMTDVRDEGLQDESVGSFIERRFHRSLAENVASAALHGIYGGDIWKLSMKSLLPSLWANEAKYGDVMSYIFDAAVHKQQWVFCDDYHTQMMVRRKSDDETRLLKTRAISVFTLRNGLGQLATGLEHALAGRANVTIKRQSTISMIEQTQDSPLEVTYESKADGPGRKETSKFSHVISTIGPRALIPLLKTSQHHRTSLERSIGSTEAVTIMVVNLYYDTPELLLTVQPPGGLPRSTNGLRGFGYLIPASVPFSQNPERALGVIFDSDVTPELWTTVSPERLGTKLTVMLGGHWWDEWTSFPTEEEAKEMAQSVLQRHLGITQQPAAAMTTLQRDCIPQYTVGHTQRMSEAHGTLMEAFRGRLRVTGSWFTGVGVNDCLRGAFDVATGLAADLPDEPIDDRGLSRAIKTSRERNDNIVHRGHRTGLESFRHGRPMALMTFGGKNGGGSPLVDIDPAGQEMGYFPSFKAQKTSR